MFKEFSNPESADYDITSSLRISNSEEKSINKKKEQQNKILMEIADLIGFFEDDEYLKYGITKEESLNPTIDTLKKIKETLKSINKPNTR